MQLSPSFKQKVRKYQKLLCYAAMLYLFVHGIFMALNTFMYRQIYSSDYYNNWCSSNLSSLTTNKDKPLGYFSHEEVAKSCDELRTQGVQFKKFIWYLTDGLPVKYSQKIFDHYKPHLHIYPVDLPGPKYSHAIYTSYLTGQLPTNYYGDWIKGDNLIRSIYRSFGRDKLWYIGPEWSFLAIVGKPVYNQLFGKIDIREEPLDEPHDRGYRFFYKDQEARKYFTGVLDSLELSGGSLVTHSAIFDHMNHGVYRQVPHQLHVLDNIADKIAADVNELKTWIDKHPDYLLIFSSDHGVDDTSNGYVLHGHSNNGNEGYLMMYNPQLQSYHEKRIDVVDFAPTLAKYLYDVDIPADNIGVTQAFTSSSDSPALRRAALKQNIAQLTDTSIRRGAKSTLTAKKIHGLLKIDTLDDNPEELNDELLRVATQMKNKLYNLIREPWEWLIIYLVATVTLIILLMIFYNRDMLHLITRRDTLCNGMLYALIVVSLLFGLLIHVLFAWDTWKARVNEGWPWRITQASFTAILWFLLTRYSSRTILQTERVLCSTLIDILYLTLLTLFKDQWKWFAQERFVSLVVPYVMLLIVLLLIAETNPLDILRFVFRRATKTQHPGHALVAFVMVLLMLGYEATREANVTTHASNTYAAYYILFGDMHIIYCGLLLVMVVHVLAVLLVWFDQLHLLLLPVNVYAFTLMKDSTTGRIMLMLLNVQYMGCLVPFTMQLFNKKPQQQQQQQSKKNDDAEDVLTKTITTNQQSSQQPLFGRFDMLLKQSLILYMMNQPIYWFVTAREEKLNLDAHPFAGAVGMKSHQFHPNFNAFQMAFEKWAFIAVFALSLYRISVATRREFTGMVMNMYTYAVLSCHMVLQLLLCVLTAWHAYEECIIYDLMVCLFASLFAGAVMWTQLYPLVLGCCRALPITKAGKRRKDEIVSMPLLPLLRTTSEPQEKAE